MPNIVITEAEFKLLSKTTQKELWGLLSQSFANFDLLVDDNKSSKTSGLESDLFNKQAKMSDWFVHRAKIRSSNKPYDEYLDLHRILFKSLPNILVSTGPVLVDFISLELAIAVLLGLNTDSQAVIKKFCHRGMVTREELAEVLGDEKKINGTIGSINRRFVKRFDPKLAASHERLRLIKFEKQFQKYLLSVDSGVFLHAFNIIDAGYKIGIGNICLTPKKDDKEVSSIMIEELAIMSGLEGQAFASTVSYSTDYHTEMHSLIASAGITSVSSTLVWELNGADEWFDDEGNALDGTFDLHNHGYEVSFGRQMPWISSQKQNHQSEPFTSEILGKKN